MDIGIYSRTYLGSMGEVFRKIHEHGLRHVHLNLQTCGLETMPSSVDEARLREIQQSAEENNVIFAGLSGTFNMIASDYAEREEGIERFGFLCQIANLINAPMISLCTGSRNPRSRWEWDERNLLPDAWEELLRTTERILPLAEKFNILLGVETEASNVVNTPQQARRYLDSFMSPHLKIIMDGANLFIPSQVPYMRQVLEVAFNLLGRDIIQAHAKDLKGGEKLEFTAAGEGVLDFPFFVELLKRYKYDGIMMLHGLDETQVPTAMSYLRGVLDNA